MTCAKYYSETKIAILSMHSRCDCQLVGNKGENACQNDVFIVFLLLCIYLLCLSILTNQIL